MILINGVSMFRLFINYRMLLLLPIILFHLQGNMFLLHEFLSDSVYDNDDDIAYELSTNDFKSPKRPSLSSIFQTTIIIVATLHEALNLEEPAGIAPTHQNLPSFLSVNSLAFEASPNKAPPLQNFTNI